MGIRTYDPAKVLTTFAGIIISGFAEGTFLLAERNEDSYKLHIGAAGEGARSKSNNKSGRITFTLMQTSPVNDLLSALAQVDEQTNKGTGALLIKDLGGTSFVGAQSAWIVKPASLEAGQEAGNRVWVIETDSMPIFIGGNHRT